MLRTFPLQPPKGDYSTAKGLEVLCRTEWHNIVVWRKGLVEIVEKYVHKGSKIYIDGKIRTRSYSDGMGIKRYVTEIYADSLELLDRKPDNEENNSPFLESSRSSTGMSSISENAANFSTPPTGTGRG